MRGTLAKLIYMTGPRKGEEIPLGTNRLLIGRDPENGIVVDDSHVSGSHAEVVPRGANGRYFVRDMESTNGTLLNGNQVVESDLTEGDRILVGRTCFLFREKNEDPLQAGPAEGSAEATAAKGGKEPSRKDETVEPESRVTRVTPVGAERRVFEESGGGSEAESDLRKKLSVLYNIGRRIGSIRNLSTMLERLLGVALEITDADRGFIFLLSPDSSEPILSARRGENVTGAASRTMVDEVMATGKAVLTFDAQEDARFREKESVAAAQIRAAMCVPLRGRERILGVIHVDTLHQREPFDRGDLEFLTVIGSQAAIAIENATLLEREQKARGDLEAAKEEIEAWNLQLEGKVRVRTRELEEARDRLVETERLAAIGRLAGALSHQINSPLTTVLGNARLLIRDLPKKDPQRERARWIVDGAGRIREIVQGLFRTTDPQVEEYVPGVEIYALPQRGRVMVLSCDEEILGTLKKELTPTGCHLEVRGDLGGCLSAMEMEYWDVLIMDDSFSQPQGKPLSVRLEESAPGIAIFRIGPPGGDDGSLYSGVLPRPLPPGEVIRARVESAIERRRLIELNRRLLQENRKLRSSVREDGKDEG